MKKITIVGLGFVAEHLNSSYIRDPYRFEPSSSSIEKFIEQSKPDVVISCLGKTGRPNIDECEQKKSETIVANVTIPSLLAESTNRHGIKLIHIGSGCIFSGPSPNPSGWNENDVANPVSFYSKTKYSLDLAISDLENVTILRIRMPVSNKPVPRNFISKILQYSHVIDVPNSMTFMGDFERAVDWVVDNEKRGVYHVTNPGELTAAQFVREYQQYCPSHQFTAITAEQLDGLTKARRSNCLLDSSKIEKEGFQLQSASSLLKQYVKQYFDNQKEK